MNLNSTTYQVQKDTYIRSSRHVPTDRNKSSHLVENSPIDSDLHRTAAATIDEEDGVPLTSAENRAIYLAVLAGQMILGLIIYVFVVM